MARRLYQRQAAYSSRSEPVWNCGDYTTHLLVQFPRSVIHAGGSS